MSQNEKSVADESKQRRSPSFPMLPIDEAIDRARLIYAADKRALTDFKTLVSHIGYKVENKGGRAGRVVSTLKQYGLLEERGGKYRITETGWRILEMPEDETERAKLIKESALRPTIVRKLLSYYSGQLPSDATLRSHLIFNEGFNADSTRDFIKVLRRTIELVNPSPEDYTLAPETERANEMIRAGGTPMPSPQPPTQRPTGLLSPEMHREFLRSSAFGAAHTLLSQQPPATSEGLNFQVSEDSINISFNGAVTQEIIRKLIKHLEINIEDFPTKAELLNRTSSPPPEDETA